MTSARIDELRKMKAVIAMFLIIPYLCIRNQENGRTHYIFHYELTVIIVNRLHIS